MPATTTAGKEAVGVTATPAFGFVVTLQARPGMEEAVVTFLAEARKIVDDEPGTQTWYAVRSGPSTFVIFDTFDSERDRELHLHGDVRVALEQRGAELFETPPDIRPVTVLAAKPRR